MAVRRPASLTLEPTGRPASAWTEAALRSGSRPTATRPSRSRPTAGGLRRLWWPASTTPPACTRSGHHISPSPRVAFCHHRGKGRTQPRDGASSNGHGPASARSMCGFRSSAADLSHGTSYQGSKDTSPTARRTPSFDRYSTNVWSRRFAKCRRRYSGQVQAMTSRVPSVSLKSERVGADSRYRSLMRLSVRGRCKAREGRPGAGSPNQPLIPPSDHRPTRCGGPIRRAASAATHLVEVTKTSVRLILDEQPPAVRDGLASSDGGDDRAG